MDESRWPKKFKVVVEPSGRKFSWCVCALCNFSIMGDVWRKYSWPNLSILSGASVCPVSGYRRTAAKAEESGRASVRRICEWQRDYEKQYANWVSQKYEVEMECDG